MNKDMNKEQKEKKFKEVKDATQFIVSLAENRRFSELREYMEWYANYYYSSWVSKHPMPTLNLPDTIDEFSGICCVDIDDENGDVTITVEKDRE